MVTITRRGRRVTLAYATGEVVLRYSTWLRAIRAARYLRRNR